MKQSRETLWTLDELGARVVLALAVDYVGQANGRIRDLPDRRTIRYYTTLGLIDRPALMRGRTALYGPRHLWQLAAIKRLQANGLSLAEIQTRLHGLTDAALRQIAKIPPDFEPAQPSGAQREPAATAKTEERKSFWSAAPAPVAAERETPPAALVGVPLEAGVTLLLDSRRPLDEHDCSALRLAAAPLLKYLHARRLVGGEGATPRQGETT